MHCYYQQCKASLNTVDSCFVEIFPCGCKLCSNCCMKLLAIKYNDRPTKCLACKQPQVITSYTSYRNNADGSLEELDIVNVRPPTTDPIAVWNQQLANSKEPKQGKGLLCLVEYDKEDAPSMKTESFKFERGEQVGEDDKDGIVAIFRKLHRVLIPKGSYKGGTGKDINGIVEEAFEDSCLLQHCLLALATGCDISDETLAMIGHSTKRNHRSDVLACFCAKELILRCSGNISSRQQPSNLQTAVGCYLSSRGLDRAGIETLSSFRLSASFSYLERLKYTSVGSELQSRPFPSALDWVVHQNDNLVMHYRGGVGGVDQWTIATAKIVPEKALRELGHYNDDPSKRPSWERKELEDVLQTIPGSDSEKTKLILANEKDVDLLSAYTLYHMEYVAKMKTPTLDQCRDGVDTWKETKTVCLLGTELARNLGVDVHPQKKYDQFGRRVPFCVRRYNSTAPEHPDDYDVTIVDPNCKSLLDVNNMFVDLPLNGDLARTDVVQGYLDGYLQAALEQTEQFEQEGSSNVVPVADKMIPYISDGSPVEKVYRLKDGDATSAKQTGTEPKLENIRCFPGAFHFKKEIVYKMSSLMEGIMRCYIAQHRATTNQQDHIMNPFDPNDFENEVIEHQAAHYRTIMESFVSSTGNQSFSLNEVHNFMLKRAREDPCANATLMLIRLNEIYFMMRDSVRANAPELFFAAIRLALPLLATTNATNYVRIGVEILVWESTCSEAEKSLFEEFCFTRLTFEGEHIAADEFEEKINQEMRKLVGSVVTPGLKDKMVAATQKLNETAFIRKQADAVRSVRRSRRRKFNESYVRVGIPFASVYLTLKTSRVWDEGPTLVGAKEETLLEAPRDVLMSPHGDYLPAEFLRFYSIGTARLIEYFVKFYIKSRYQEERPQTYGTGGIPFTTPQCSPAQFKKAREIRVDLASSITKARLIKAAKRKKQPLMEQLVVLSRKMPFDLDYNAVQKKKVPQIAAMLSTYRKRYIRDEARSQNVSESDIIESLASECELDGAKSVEHDREAELEWPFYALAEPVFQERLSEELSLSS